VFEVFQNQQPLLDDGVALLVLDMGDETYATGVVLVGRVLKTLALGEDHRVFPRKYDRQKSRGDDTPRPWMFRDTRQTVQIYRQKRLISIRCNAANDGHNSPTENRRRCSFIE
jgi:hypothetical protein